MDISNLLSSNYFPDVFEGKKIAAPGEEHGKYPDLFAAMLALMINPEGAPNMALEQADEKEVKTAEFSQNFISEDRAFGNCFEFFKNPEPIDVNTSVNLSFDNAGPSGNEGVPQDLAAFSKVLLQKTGKDENVLLELTNLISKDNEGKTYEVSLINKDSIPQNLATVFKDLHQEINIDKDYVTYKTGTELGVQEVAKINSKSNLEDHISVIELVKEFSGEIKTRTESSGNESVYDIFQGDEKSNETQGEKITLSNNDATLNSLNIENANELMQENTTPENMPKEIAVMKDFSLNHRLEPDSARIWERVVNSLKQVNLSANNEANMVKEIEISIHPAELGKLEVQMKMEDGLLHLVINASEQATGNYLQSYLGELRQSLTQIGISCGSMEMGFQGEGKPEQEKEREAPPNHNLYGAGEEENFDYEKITYYLQDLKSQTRINISV